VANEAERALRHAVRVHVVLHYVGELSLVVGLTALVPMAAAAIFGEFQLIVPYAVAGLLFVAIRLLAGRIPAPRRLQRSEALVVTAFVFVLTPLVMSGPLAFHGIGWGDALFEAVSGITTTGLSTLDSVETRPRTFLLARAWLQWVGGLGFVVLSLALLLEPGVATRRLGSPSLEPMDVVGSMRAHARRVLLVYLALTGIGVVALLLLGATGFDAVVHTFAAVSTGGFAPRDSSLAALASRLQWGVLGVSLLGAVSLPLYAELRRGRWRRLRDDLEVRALLVLLACLALGLVIATAGDRPANVGLSDLLLVAVSAQTTTGFASFDVTQLPAAATAMLVVAMIIGGSLGSTAGGFKLLRLLLVVRLVQWLIASTRLPVHAVAGPRLGGEHIEASELLRAAALILLFLAAVVVSWLIFLAHGYAPLAALFEVASATGTVGLSTGITRPELEPFLKGVLCVNMLLGRLEVFALLVALSPRTWIGRRTS
jgi:trk system potassium uptake protein TrkH